MNRNLVKITIIVALAAAAVTWEVSEMVHGARKWSNVGADQVAFGLQDMGELAVRLGSPDSHNREGNVIWMETFEYGLGAWSVVAYPTDVDGQAEIDSNFIRSSGYACRLTAGADIDDAIAITRRSPYPAVERYGLEYSLMVTDQQGQLWIMFTLLDGEASHEYTILVVPADEQIQIDDADLGMVTVVTGLDLAADYNLFNTFKVVFDLANDRYLRLIVNEREYDLSGYGCVVGTSLSSPRIDLEFQYINQATGESTVYLDDVILTRNELP